MDYRNDKSECLALIKASDGKYIRDIHSPCPDQIVSDIKREFRSSRRSGCLDDATATTLGRRRWKVQSVDESCQIFPKDSKKLHGAYKLDSVHESQDVLLSQEYDVTSAEDRINWALNHSSDSGYPDSGRHSSGISSSSSNHNWRTSSPSPPSSVLSHHAVVFSPKDVNENYRIPSTTEEMEMKRQLIETMTELKDLVEVARVIDDVDDEEWLLAFVCELEVYLNDVVKVDSYETVESSSAIEKKRKTILGVAQDLIRYLKERCKNAFALRESQSMNEGGSENRDIVDLRQSWEEFNMNKWQRRLSRLAKSLDKYLGVLAAPEMQRNANQVQIQPKINGKELVACDEHKQSLSKMLSCRKDNFDSRLHNDDLPSEKSLSSNLCENDKTSKLLHDEDLQRRISPLHASSFNDPQSSTIPADSYSDQVSGTSSLSSVSARSLEVDGYHANENNFQYYVEIDQRNKNMPFAEICGEDMNPAQYRATIYSCPGSQSTDNSPCGINSTNDETDSIQLVSPIDPDLSASHPNEFLDSRPNPDQLSSNGIETSIKEERSKSCKVSATSTMFIKPRNASTSLSSETNGEKQVPTPKKRNKLGNKKTTIKLSVGGSVHEKSVPLNLSCDEKKRWMSQWNGKTTQPIKNGMPTNTATSSVQCSIVSKDAIAKRDGEIDKLRKSAELLRRGITEAREDRDDKDRKIAILESKVQRLKKNIEDGKREQGSAVDELARLHKLLDKEKRDHDLQILQLEEACKELKTEELNKQRRIEDLERWIENLKEERNGPLEQCKKLEEEKQELEAKIYELTLLLVKEKRQNRRMHVENVNLEMQIANYKEKERSEIKEKDEKVKEDVDTVLDDVIGQTVENCSMTSVDEVNQTRRELAAAKLLNTELKVKNDHLQKVLTKQKDEAADATDCFRQQVEFLSKEVSLQRETVRVQKEKYDKEIDRLLSSNSSKTKSIQESEDDISFENESLRSQLIYQETLTKTLYKENERLREERDSTRMKLESANAELNIPKNQDFSCQMDDMTYTKMKAHDFYLQEALRNAKRLKERGSKLRLQTKRAQSRVTCHTNVQSSVNIEFGSSSTQSS